MLGIHVLPVRYYQPIPDTGELPDSLWGAKPEMPGINMADSAQIELLGIFADAYKNEYDFLSGGSIPGDNQYYVNNPAFGVVNAEILYSFVRYFKPREIIEIGAGFSTFITAQAVRKTKRKIPGFPAISPQSNLTPAIFYEKASPD